MTSTVSERDILLRVARRMGFPQDNDFGLTTWQISLWIAALDLTTTICRDEEGCILEAGEEMYEVLAIVGEVERPSNHAPFYGDGITFYSTQYESPFDRRAVFEAAAKKWAAQ